jgi:hypothetical protein
MNIVANDVVENERRGVKMVDILWVFVNKKYKLERYRKNKKNPLTTVKKQNYQ